MVGRDRDEAGRASTPLELLFDLCFVVAVSSAANELHQFVAVGHIGQGLIGYLTVFFAIWWAWMNFTWFASAYDTDDIRYRLLTFVQIAGVLAIAARGARHDGAAGLHRGHHRVRPVAAVDGRPVAQHRGRRSGAPPRRGARAHVRADGRLRRDDPGDGVPGGARW